MPRKRSDIKILFLDIETAPTKVYTWSLFPKYIHIDDVQKAGYTLCWAAMWLGDSKVQFSGLNTDSEKAMLIKIHELLDEADAVVHYNGTKFDIPTLNREFLRNGMTPPSQYHQIDLLKTIRKQFRFQSNKLDFVCQQLGLGGKVKHKGMALWYGCMEDDDVSWKQMETYNKRDVKILKKLYDKILPWIHNHPNIGMWITDPLKPVCPNCGSTSLHEKGNQYNTKTTSYKRYKCLTCGTPSRSRLQTQRTSPNVTTRTN